MADKVRKLNEIDKEFLKSKTPYALPDNPSNKGFSASQIKAKMYEGHLVVYEWLKQLQAETNVAFDLNDAAIAVINSAIDTINATKATKVELADLQEDIEDGTITAYKATRDGDGLVIASNYGVSLVLSYDDLLNKITLRLYASDNTLLDTKHLTLPKATALIDGLQSKEHFEKLEALPTNGQLDSALAVKVPATRTIIGLDLADNILLDEFKTALGEAIEGVSGLMSATDKARLDALHALLGVEADADAVVNTINEVLAIFNTYQEGADLVSALGGKVDKVAGKGLSKNDYSDIEKNKVALSDTHRQDTNNPHSTTFDQVLNKPTTIAGYGITDAYNKEYIDALKDLNGWSSALLTPTALTNGQTIALATLQQYDIIKLFARRISDNEIDTDSFDTSVGLGSNYKYIFFDNADISLTIGETDCVFATTAGYELKIIGQKYVAQEAENVVYDETSNVKVALDKVNYGFQKLPIDEIKYLTSPYVSDRALVAGVTGYAFPFLASNFGKYITKIKAHINITTTATVLCEIRSKTFDTILASVSKEISAGENEFVLERVFDTSIITDDIFYVSFSVPYVSGGTNLMMNLTTNTFTYKTEMIALGYKVGVKTYGSWTLNAGDSYYQANIEITSYNIPLIQSKKLASQKLSVNNLMLNKTLNNVLARGNVAFEFDTDDSIKVTATERYAGIKLSNKVVQTIGHYYFYSAVVKANDESQSIAITFSEGVYPPISTQLKTYENGVWRRFSGIAKFQLTTYGNLIIENHSLANWTVPFNVKELISIDLTELYGDIAPLLNPKWIETQLINTVSGGFGEEQVELIDLLTVNKNFIENKLLGKYLVCAGDSWTQATQVIPSFDYGYRIAKKYGMRYLNAGLSGSRISNGGSVASFVGTNEERTNSIARFQTLPDDIDYLTLFFGINDANASVPLGNIDSDVDTEFYGAWNIVLSYLINKYPTALIGLIIPQSISSKYTNAIRNIALRYGVPIYDLESDYAPNIGYKKSCLPAINAIIKNALTISDHPNNTAYDILAETIGNWIYSGMGNGGSVDVIPTIPTAEGTYTLKVVISASGIPTFSWVSDV